MKAGEFLNEIFTSLGIDPTDEALAKLVTQTVTIELPDDFKTKFHEIYMTSDVARAKLKPEVIAGFAKGLEESAIAKAKALGFTDEEIKATEVGAGKTPQRVEALMEMMDKKAKELVKKGSTGLAEEYKKQLEDLQGKLENEKTDAIKPYVEKLSKMESRLFAEWEKAEYADLPLAKHFANLPTSAKRALIKDAIDQELSTLNGELLFDFETGLPKLTKKGEKDVPLFHENKPIEFKTLKGLAIQRQKLDVEAGGGPNDDPAKEKIVIPNTGVDGKNMGLNQLANNAYSVSLNSLPKE